MPSAPSLVELIPSRDIEHFLPVLREIDLGDRFLLSMLHWCGIGQRSSPLSYWQVYIIRNTSEIVGVTGLYQRPETEKHIYWLGWFGIRPQWRRQRLGSESVRRVIEKAKERGGRELWVYTGAADQPAVRFYLSLGFEVLGTATSTAPGQTMAESDIILKRSI